MQALFNVAIYNEYNIAWNKMVEYVRLFIYNNVEKLVKIRGM